VRRTLFHVSIALVALSAFLFLLFRYLPLSIIVSRDGFAIVMTILIVAGLASILCSLIRPKAVSVVRAEPVFLLAVGLVLTLPFVFMGLSFGTRDVGSLISAYQGNQAGELLRIGIAEFLPTILKLTWQAFLLLTCAYMTAKYARFGRFLVSTGALILILLGPIPFYLYRSMVPSTAHAAIAPELASLEPMILERPHQKLNLVMIYLESLERTYAQIEAVETEYAFFKEVEASALAFTNVDQLASTGFTIAGLVATQCGVPLVPNGAFNVHKKHPKYAEAMPDTRNFLSSVTCLSDILSEDGYNLSYINGSNLTIYGKGDFHESHGYSRVLGLSSFPGWENEPRTNIWGMDDDLLFERATTLLHELAKAERPFVLSMLTIATHGPAGFPDARCAPKADPEAENLLPEAIGCTAKHVARLLEEIDALGIGDDTLVLLTSDHLAMKNSFTSELTAPTRERRNFVSLLGTGIQDQIDRPATMIDIYPTLLEAMGYEIEGGKAGLGVSLLSNGATLAERHGILNVDKAVEFNLDLQQAVWK